MHFTKQNGVRRHPSLGSNAQAHPTVNEKLERVSIRVSKEFLAQLPRFETTVRDHLVQLRRLRTLKGDRYDLHHTHQSSMRTIGSWMLQISDELEGLSENIKQEWEEEEEAVAVAAAVGAAADDAEEEEEQRAKHAAADLLGADAGTETMAVEDMDWQPSVAGGADAAH